MQRQILCLSILPALFLHALTCCSISWYLWVANKDHHLMTFSKEATFLQNHFTKKLICDLISQPIFTFVLTNERVFQLSRRLCYYMSGTFTISFNTKKI